MPSSQVSRARHLGVDDERRVPRVPAALGPHQIEGLQRDVSVVIHAAAAALVAVIVAVTRRVTLVVFGGCPDGRVRGGSGLPFVIVSLAFWELETYLDLITLQRTSKVKGSIPSTASCVSIPSFYGFKCVKRPSLAK